MQARHQLETRPGAGLWLYVGMTVTAWASAFIAIRVAIDGYSPIALVLGRFVVTSLVVSAVWLPRLEVSTLPSPRRSDYLRLLVMGLSGAVVYNLLLAHGQKVVSAFGASLLINTVPIWTVLLAWVHLRERLRPVAWMGVLLGFVGASLVGALDGGLAFEISGAVAILLAAVAQGLYFVVLRSVVVRIGAERATLWTFWVATAALLPFGGTLLSELAVAPPRATLAVLYLGVVPGSLGTWSWARSMERAPASRLAVFLYLVPPLAALMGWLVLEEVPTPGVLVGGLVSVGGVALVSLLGRDAASGQVSARPREHRRALVPPAGRALALAGVAPTEQCERRSRSSEVNR